MKAKQKAATKETPFCTIAEAAERAGLSQFYFRKGIQSGQVPSIRSGRCVFVNWWQWCRENGILQEGVNA